MRLAMSKITDKKTVTIATLGRAQGLRGEIRAQVFLEDPIMIKSFNPVWTDRQTQIHIQKIRPVKNGHVLSLRDVTTREAAEALNGVRLTILRDRLPKLSEPDDFYHEDLIGLQATDEAGTNYGKIVAIHNFGAGDMLELRGGASKASLMIPFSEAAVPKIDLETGKITINRIAAGLDDDDDGDDFNPDSGAQ